jgi:hypothetical protein
MSAVVLAFLEFDNVKLGTCWINAGSSHLYKKDFDRIKKIDDEMLDIWDPLFMWPKNYESIISMLMNFAETS